MSKTSAYLHTLKVVRWFVAGLLLTIALAWGSAQFLRPTMVAQTVTSARRGDEMIGVTVEDGRFSRSIIVSHVFGQNWSPARALGPPDTPRMGDISTAWASLTPDAQVEWLELTFDSAITPQSIRIYETNAPGALVSITGVDASGARRDLWSGQDPAAPDANGICVATIPISSEVALTAVRLVLDSPKVSGWNEIDAVALIDQQGQPHWATGATASTTYADNYSAAPAKSMGELRRGVPGWIPTEWENQASGVQTIRRYEGRGWPFIALWGEVPPDAATINPLRLYRPAWLGLLGDSVLFGIALFLLYQCTFGLRRFIREGSRARRGCCVQCGYDLRFDLAAGCPECGWRRQ